MAAKSGNIFGYGVFGLFMGLVLGLSGFADFEQVHKMFTFQDLNLLFAFAGAVGISMLGFLLLARKDHSNKKNFNKGMIPGSMVFGAGWAITGACPGIALVQVGQGQLGAVFTLLGILGGVWLYRMLAAGGMQVDTGICGEQ